MTTVPAAPLTVPFSPLVEFVCNLPGDEPGLTEVLRAGLVPGCVDHVWSALDPSWRRVGDNFVGPAYGENPCPGDVGIYYLHRPPGIFHGQERQDRRLP